MSSENIGKNIAVLRREKGVRQEELAKFVGVTAQAVSKWENGGVPDTELLPGIADFFGVPIDRLFGRDSGEFFTVEDAIVRDLGAVAPEERLERMFGLCWMMEQAAFGKIFSTPEQLKDEALEHGQNDQVYSRILRDEGYTAMGLFNRMKYFLLVPDARDKRLALLEGIDYPGLFRVLGEKEVFDALVFLYSRESKNAFTEKLLVRELGLSPERAKETVSVLLGLGLLAADVAQIDDEEIRIYRFRASSAFVSMLIFARELIDAPGAFYVSYDGRHKPYLK